MMIEFDKKAEILLRIDYRSPYSEHIENFFFELNLWRECEILPKWFLNEIVGREEGEEFEFTIKGSEFFNFSYENLLELDINSFKPPKLERAIKPRVGRFYPLGFFPYVKGAFPQNIKPVRVVETNEVLKVDLNHPSSYFDFKCKVKILKVKEKKVELGGSCRDLFEEAFEGVGMQVRYHGIPTDFEFGEKDSFSRLDESDDYIFYRNPRFTSHIDSKCHENLVKTYAEILPSSGKILDFMSGYQSHIPNGDYEVIGLGLNSEEMKLNPSLNDFVVHDVNKNPKLPFENEEFDAIVCDFSIGYVVDPIAIFRELDRILKKKGLIAFSFSNRLFPQKAVRIWREILDYEKLGYVTELFIRNGWSKIATITHRGYPRPWEDRYSLTQKFSDPLYLAYGIKN